MVVGQETARVYMSVFRRFREWIEARGIPLEQAEKHIGEFIASLPNRSDKTKKSYASAIRHFLRPSRDNVPVIPRWDDDGNWVSWRNRAIALLVSSLPLSPQAVSELNRADYTPGSDYIVWRGGKMFINELTRQALDKYIALCPYPAHSPSSPLFLSTSGKRMRATTLRAVVASTLGANVRSVRFSPPVADGLSLEEFERLFTTDAIDLSHRAAIVLCTNGVPLGIVARAHRSDFLLNEEVFVQGHRIVHGAEVIKEWLSSHDGYLLTQYDGKPVTKQMAARIISNAVFMATGKKVHAPLLSKYYRRAVKSRNHTVRRAIDKLLAKMERLQAPVDEATLHRLLETLTPTEREVLEKRYLHGLKLHEVGEIFGVSKQRIHAIESQAIKKLARAAKAKTTGS